MSARQNLAVVQQQMSAAFVRGEIPTLFTIPTEDVDGQSPGPVAIPWASRWHSRDEGARWSTLSGDTAVCAACPPQEFCVRGDQGMVGNQYGTVDGVVSAVPKDRGIGYVGVQGGGIGLPSPH
jgi:hypothetical protein